MITAFFEDLRYAGRGLRRDPLLALVATLTLAICIAANTTVFSVVDSILIRPLAYPDSQRIDWISERSGPAQQDVGVAPDYFAIRAQNGIFEDVAAFSPSTVNWTGVDRPEQLDASSVSASFFNVMGTKPADRPLLQCGRRRSESAGGRGRELCILANPAWKRPFHRRQKYRS